MPKADMEQLLTKEHGKNILKNNKQNRKNLKKTV